MAKLLLKNIKKFFKIIINHTELLSIVIKSVSFNMSCSNFNSYGKEIKQLTIIHDPNELKVSIQHFYNKKILIKKLSMQFL